MSLHLGILTSCNIVRLRKCIDSCKPQFEKITVFINTLDEDYRNRAENLCKDLNLNYAITDSNGTPAVGKNSMLEWFTENTFDSYYAFIDGDDTFSDNAVETITNNLHGDILTVDIPHTEEAKAATRFVDKLTTKYYIDLLEKEIKYGANRRVIAVSRSALCYIRYDECLHTLEDIHFAFKLIKSDLRIIRVDNTIYNYRSSRAGNAISSAEQMKNPKEFFERFWEGLLIE